MFVDLPFFFRSAKLSLSEQHARRTTFQREGTRAPNFRIAKKSSGHNSEKSPREEVDQTSGIVQNRKCMNRDSGIDFLVL